MKERRKKKRRKKSRKSREREKDFIQVGILL